MESLDFLKNLLYGRTKFSLLKLLGKAKDFSFGLFASMTILNKVKYSEWFYSTHLENLPTYPCWTSEPWLYNQFFFYIFIIFRD